MYWDRRLGNQSVGDERTLVDHLLKDVKHPVSWRYMFHLLCKVRDRDVKDSIKTELLSRVNRQNDPVYANFIDEVSSPQYGGVSVCPNVSEELQIEKRMRAVASDPNFDLVETADVHTQKRFFWNALQTYRELNRVRAASHFCSERAVMHIVLDEWPKALSLAKKSGNVELLSILSFTYGDCGPCYRNVEDLCEIVKSRENTIVSAFELLWVMTFAVLSKFDFTDRKFPVTDLIGLLEDQEMADASEALRAFLRCPFQSAICKVDDCQFLADHSIYIGFTWEILKRLIITNCHVQCCRPFKSVKITELALNLGLDAEVVRDLILEATSDGLLVGRLDLVAGCFLGVQGQEPWAHKRKVLDDAAVFRIKSAEAPEAQ
jgi:hypothetical protein